MATLATQPITPTGTVPSFAAASAGGDKCHCGDSIYLAVDNGSGASVTVTLATPATVEGFAVAENAVTVAAGATAFIGPIDPALYRASDGLCAITYSASASVTVAALEF